MVKPEWGLKRKCLKCDNFFYDMRKKEFKCPKCDAKYSSETYEEMKAKQLTKLAKKTAAAIPEEEIDEETLLKLTEDVPLVEELDDAEEIDILEDGDDVEHPSLAKHDYVGEKED